MGETINAANAAKAANAVDAALELVAADMQAYEVALQTALQPQRPYIGATEMAIYAAGKRLRPLLLLLCARMEIGQGPLPQKVINAAVATEMLHVATLIHDDIIDRAPMRRGLVSVNQEKGADAAILIGDLQFVQAIRCFTSSIDTQSDMHLVDMVLSTAFKICCGELDELRTDPAAEPALLRQHYWQTIERKTAVLFGLACECGLALGGGNTRAVRKIGFYGRRLGRAFQVMDDLFDITQTLQQAGKLPGTDLACRRPSLPIIYALEEMGPESALARYMRGAEADQQALQSMLQDIKRSAGFTRAYLEARQQAMEGLLWLRDFPDSAYRQALSDLIYYVVNRGYKGT